MRTKYIAGSAVVIVLAVAFTFLYLNRNAGRPVAMTLAQAKKTASKNSPACRPDNKQKLNVPKKDAADIDMAGVLYIIDVPAGTYADVRVTTYDGKTMTGSTIYEKNYGQYNFEAKKVGNSSANGVNWEVTGFTACT